MKITQFECPYCAKEGWMKDDAEKDSWFSKEELAEHMHIAHGHRLRKVETIIQEWSGLGLLESRLVEKDSTQRRLV